MLMSQESILITCLQGIVDDFMLIIVKKSIYTIIRIVRSILNHVSACGMVKHGKCCINTKREIFGIILLLFLLQYFKIYTKMKAHVESDDAV